MEKKEKTFILTEKQLEEVLRIVAFGTLGVLLPKEVDTIQNDWPEELTREVLSNAAAGGALREKLGFKRVNKNNKAPIPESKLADQ